MLKIEQTEVMGWKHAIRGMRNPKNSWDKSDSGHCQYDLLRNCATCVHKDSDYPTCKSHFDIGPQDYKLMTSLRNAGTDHRKFMRMIVVYADITAPLYWWKEFDTYKVGTVANSCSTMHKIADKEFTLEDFSYEHLIQTDAGMRNNLCIDCSGAKDGSSMYTPFGILCSTVEMLNVCRDRYLAACITEPETGFSAKDIWWQMIQLLPSSYNQKRTIMLNYEVLANIYMSRKNHKLDEWRYFCSWIKSLPYSELIISTPEMCVEKEDEQ